MISSSEQKTEKTPELRFPEFSGAWEEKRLGEVVQLYGKKYDPKISVKSYKDIELESIESGTGTLLKIFNSKNQKSIKTYFQKDDILYGKLRPYLKKFLRAPFEGVCSSEFWVLRGKEISNSYLYQLIQTRKFNDAVNIQSGSKMPRADWSIVKNTIFSIPNNKTEQQKIAEFLSSVDAWIENLKQEKKKLEEYKKGIMQKIFSQEIRFKNEDGKNFPDWEEKKLGEVATFLKGRGISKSDIVPDGKNKCIRYGELYTRYEEVIDEVYSHTDVSLENSIVSKKNDLIIPSSGETALDIARVSCVGEKGVILGGDLNILRFKKESSGVFFAYYLSNAKKGNIASLGQGFSIVHLYSSYLKNLNISVPPLPEQQKIADFLTSLDKRIESKQKQITAAECWKKGLMQKLFV